MELFDVAIEFLANYFDDTLFLELYYKIQKYQFLL
jgi:hypothetical protein